ncbi:MAG: XrtA system polysaccharide deacetylase [Acidobacteriaceae bacterium]
MQFFDRRPALLAIALACAVVLNLWCLAHNFTPGALLTLSAGCLLAAQWLDPGRQPLSAAQPDRTRAPIGAPTVFTAAAAALSDRAAQVHDICNAFTIDLEDYFHTEVSSKSVSYEQWDDLPLRIDASVMRLLDLLDKHQTRATVFTLGWVARKRPYLIREVARRGHEIACHSYRHRPVFNLTPDEFRADTELAKDILENVTGAAVVGYRAPNFSITPGTEWAWEVLSDLGFLYDSSVNPVWHKMYANPKAPRFPYLIPETNLFEVPVATWRVCGVNLPIGGGAYLRLLPLPYMRAGLAYVNAIERRPVTLYMHPWEIDHYQPEFATDWKSHIRQTWGVDGMEDKLVSLLRASRFSTILDVHSQHLPSAAAISALRMEPEPLARVS